MTTAPRPRRQAALRRLGELRGYRQSGGMLNLDFSGRIGDRPGDISAARIEEQLAANPCATMLWSTIDCGGGVLRDAERIYDAVRRHPARSKVCTVIGDCLSAASIVLLAHDHREARVPGSRFLLHAAELPFRHDAHRGTAARHRECAETLARADARIVSIIAERTGASRRKIEAELATEAYLPFHRVLALGLVHGREGEDPLMALAARGIINDPGKLAAMRAAMFQAVRSGRLSPGLPIGHIAFSRAATRYGDNRG